jgi:hypothetical protein
MKSRTAVTLVIAVLLSWPGAALADESFIYYGTTVGGPLFNRPSTTSPFTPTGVVVSYEIQAFQVNQTTTCIVSSVQNGLFDGFLHIYQAQFNPVVSQNNVIAANDDDGTGLGVGSSRITPPFQALANTPYFVVTSAFAAGNNGDFQNTVSCNSQGLPIPLVITHGNCTNLQNNTRACLVNDRFQVSATFVTGLGAPTLDAQVVQFGSDNSALFWFFNPQNWELQLKVLNFCNQAENAYRLFASGTTTVGVTVRVVDTLRGGSGTIVNPIGSAFTNQVFNIPGSCP